MVTATRRRGAELEEAIHAAVMAELANKGYAGLTFEGVAAAAATSKAVLYRRSPTKAELILAAVIASNQPLAVTTNTGSLKGDLRELMTLGRSAFAGMRHTLLGLLAELDGPAADRLRALVFARSAELVEPLVERARRRGELGEAPIAPRVLTLALDLLRHETLLRGSLENDDIDELLEQCVLPLLTSSSTRPGVTRPE